VIRKMGQTPTQTRATGLGAQAIPAWISRKVEVVSDRKISCFMAAGMRAKLPRSQKQFPLVPEQPQTTR
jgi:hypothetical protein